MRSWRQRVPGLTIICLAILLTATGCQKGNSSAAEEILQGTIQDQNLAPLAEVMVFSDRTEATVSGGQLGVYQLHRAVGSHNITYAAAGFRAETYLGLTKNPFNAQLRLAAGTGQVKVRVYPPDDFVFPASGELPVYIAISDDLGELITLHEDDPYTEVTLTEAPPKLFAVSAIEVSEREEAERLFGLAQGLYAAPGAEISVNLYLTQLPTLELSGQVQLIEDATITLWVETYLGLDGNIILGGIAEPDAAGNYSIKIVEFPSATYLSVYGQAEKTDGSILTGWAFAPFAEDLETEITFPLTSAPAVNVSQTDGSLRVNWEPVPEADLYRVYIFKRADENAPWRYLWQCWTQGQSAVYPTFPDALQAEFDLQGEGEFFLTVEAVSVPGFDINANNSLSSFKGLSASSLYPLEKK